MTAAQMDSLQANDYNWTVSTKTASYVLVAADKGTRVVMNNAGATTITVNTGLFNAGDTLFIQNIGAGTCTITAATATVTTAGSLALGTWAGGTLYFTSASAAIFFSGGAPAYGTATGGIGSPTSVTISGVNYQYLTFTSTGTLTVTRAGFFDYCAVGGGGGHLSYNDLANGAGGGGGGGQVVVGSVYLSANQTITIGAGGPFYGYATSYTQAGNTSIAATSPFTQTALGNFVGSRHNDLIVTSFVGGGAGNGNTRSQGSFTGNDALGQKGGNSTLTSNGGGGGGNGIGSSAGGNGSGTTGGTGGAGFDVSAFIGGSELRKGMGGGGGGTVAGGAAATNGVGGSTGTTPSNGNANSGGGGGAGVGNTTSGNGGSGICYIRWKV